MTKTPISHRTLIIKVRNNKQVLTQVLVCPSGCQLVLVGSSLFLLSCTLSIFSSDYLPHEPQTPELRTKTALQILVNQLLELCTIKSLQQILKVFVSEAFV